MTFPFPAADVLICSAVPACSESASALPPGLCLCRQLPAGAPCQDSRGASVRHTAKELRNQGKQARNPRLDQYLQRSSPAHSLTSPPLLSAHLGTRARVPRDQVISSLLLHGQTRSPPDHLTSPHLPFQLPSPSGPTTHRLHSPARHPHSHPHPHPHLPSTGWRTPHRTTPHHEPRRTKE